MRSHHTTGFTLIELLVALAVTALVSLLLLHGLQLAVTGLDRLSYRSDELDRRRGAADALQALFASAFMPPRNAGPAFEGAPDRISFLSLVEDGNPGIYRVDVTLDAARSDRPLILSRRLVSAGAMQSQRSVLVRRVRAVAFAYFGTAATDREPAWHRRWEGLAVLPREVRMTVAAGDGEPSETFVMPLWSGR
jgi:prepilin-type N-terminal cleavage/methylation domain-containing protein